MVMKKAELIEKKLEEGKLSINEARLLFDLEPIVSYPCFQFFNKLDGGTKEMKGYKETIIHLPELIKIVEALEKLNKEYTITKRTETHGKDDKYPRIESVWDVEEKVQ